MNPAVKLILAAMGGVAMLAGMSCSLLIVLIGMWVLSHRPMTNPSLAFTVLGITVILNLLAFVGIRFFFRKPKGWSARGASRDLFIGVLAISWAFGSVITVAGVLMR
jgi:hypothetical protein